MKYDFDVAVIGAGTAGLVSAFVADSLGARVALIEADKVGGECLWRGCVPSKTLIRSARAWEQVKRCEEFGVHVEKPRLVWSAIRLRLADVRDDIRRLEREQLAASNLTSISGRARFVDEHTLQISGANARTLTAEKVHSRDGFKSHHSRRGRLARSRIHRSARLVRAPQFAA
jgi:glutathione reductase (NADPH)